MSKDPYYKCNTVTTDEKRNLQNQGAKFANVATQDGVNWSAFVLGFIIVVAFIVFNMQINTNTQLSSTLVLGVLVLCLFIVLILWFTGIARNEGFKGKGKGKGKGKSKGKGKDKGKDTGITANAPTTNSNPTPTKKSNLNPTLLAVLPIFGLGFVATIANVLYHR